MTIFITLALSILNNYGMSVFLQLSILFRDGNPNPTTFLDPEKIRNLNSGLLIFTTFVEFKKNIFIVSFMFILD